MSLRGDTTLTDIPGREHRYGIVSLVGFPGRLKEAARRRPPRAHVWAAIPGVGVRIDGLRGELRARTRFLRDRA
jgi:hypothetical protein